MLGNNFPGGQPHGEQCAPGALFSQKKKVSIKFALSKLEPMMDLANSYKVFDASGSLASF